MAARRCRIFFLAITLLVNALDFISDWLFYVSAEKVEKGLVYGPIEPTQVTALLVFSIVGTVGFVIEIAVFAFELRKGEDFHGDLLLDITSAVIIWFEDIPQVVISFSIALCREEAVSIFQLTKAGLVLVGVLISITATLVRFCRTCDTKATVCGVRFCLILGIFLEGSFAAAIFALTQTEQGENGEMFFKVPTTVIDDHLSDERYITNVNLFAHHADMFDAWNMDTNKKDAMANWINLFSLYNLKDNKVLSFKLNYEHVGVQLLNLGIWVAAGVYSTSHTTWTLSGCYSLNHKTAKVTILPNSTCESESFSGNNSEIFFMSFRYEEPDTGIFYRKRVFGEVIFNMKVLKNGNCSEGNFEDPLKNSGILYYPLTFHYFRINNANDTGEVRHLYKDTSPDDVRFFRKDSKDITDVSEVWKTGWSKCSSTGSMSPVRNKNIQVECA
ncbi:unnamed protein product [Candidula unifasciata]|uniref:Uncharacterized protein n=1 Tax=Candidula unifasciata TaxID=100452 RepID=A0A8S3Z3C0_9EUPU|nr:unnamed protein product [Candidula unifasciata]